MASPLSSTAHCASTSTAAAISAAASQPPTLPNTINTATAAAAATAQKDAKTAAATPVRELKTRVVNVMVNTITNICTDNRTRLQENRVDGGVYYAHHYFNALKKIGKPEESRLKALQREEAFARGQVPKKFFDPVTPYVMNEFVVKAGKSPSEALTKWCKGVTFSDCFNACAIARYFGLLEALGKEKFDGLFGRHSFCPLTVGKQSKSILELFCKNFGRPTEIDINAVEKGSMIFFRNAYRSKPDQPSYFDKHGFIGSSAGFYTICTDHSLKGMSKPVFHGFGMDPTGENHDQIKITLLDSQNSKPADGAWLSSKLAKDIKGNEKWKDHKYTPAQFEAAGGGEFRQVLEFDYEALAEYTTLSVDQIKERLVVKKKELAKLEKEEKAKKSLVKAASLAAMSAKLERKLTHG